MIAPVSKQDRLESMRTLRDLELLLEVAINYLDSDAPMMANDHLEPMAYDFVLGGRFAIIDLKKRDELKKEWAR